MRIDIERGSSGLWLATSPDDRGFLAVAKDLPDCLREAAHVVEQLALARAELAAKTKPGGGTVVS